jgi:hypothetical protein
VQSAHQRLKRSHWKRTRIFREVLKSSWDKVHVAYRRSKYAQIISQVWASIVEGSEKDRGIVAYWRNHVKWSSELRRSRSLVVEWKDKYVRIAEHDVSRADFDSHTRAGCMRIEVLNIRYSTRHNMKEDISLDSVQDTGLVDFKLLANF